MQRRSNGHHEQNGRNGHTNNNRQRDGQSFSLQSIINNVVDNRLEREDSAWTPELSLSSIRNNIFQEAREHCRQRDEAFRHGPFRALNSSSHPSLTRDTHSSPGFSQHPRLSSNSTDSDLHTPQGHHTFYYGDISVSRISRQSQSSPINLSLQKDRKSSSEDAEEESSNSPDWENGDSREPFRRRHSTEGTNSDAGQSHWKKLMVSRDKGKDN